MMDISRMAVNGYGPTPNDVMLVGEAPGVVEARFGRPFVGPSGKEQRLYLARSGVKVNTLYATNVVKEYKEGNPDPIPSDIDFWSDTLLSEIAAVNPKLIIAVGRFAARWFLGDDADMRVVHGILQHPAGFYTGSFFPEVAPYLVLPVYHPAFGLHDPNMKAVVYSDYCKAAVAIKQLRVGRELKVVEDTIGDSAQYLDVSGGELVDVISYHSAGAPIGLDTENDSTWRSIQVSFDEGVGLVLRADRDDFDVGIAALQVLIDSGVTVSMHYAVHDIIDCRSMGLDLSRADIFDTMYAAYVMRDEPQGLAALLWRWCGMCKVKYKDAVGGAARGKQLRYLADVCDAKYPRIPKQWVVDDTGAGKYYQPLSISSYASKIIKDVSSGKVNKKGEKTDPEKRWAKIADNVKHEAADNHGQFPTSGLGDLPFDDAVAYSGLDPDGSLRLHNAMLPVLRERKLEGLMSRSTLFIPIVEEMQTTGLYASRPHFEALSKDLKAIMDSKIVELQGYFPLVGNELQSFNPRSAPQTRKLLDIRGIVSPLLTKKTKLPSTSKKAIEQFRYIDPAIALLFEWREAAHTRSGYCKSVIKAGQEIESYDMDEEVDGDVIDPESLALDGERRHQDDRRFWGGLAGQGEFGGLIPIHSNFKYTRTTSRRLATTDPNLLAIPAHGTVGKRVRNGYVAPPGYKLLACDLNAIEVRIAAHLSKDKLLCALFNDGRDVHSETAARIFGVALADVDDDTQRTPAKRAGFGILYGIGAQGLNTQLQMMGLVGWDESSCQDVIDSWLSLYSGVRDYIAHITAKLHRDGYVRGVWSGMPRSLPGIWATETKKSAQLRAECARMAVSHMVQEGAQDLMQRGMINLWNRQGGLYDLRASGCGVRGCLQLHDEVMLLFEEGLEDILEPLVLDSLTVGHGLGKLAVPITASCHVGGVWGELK